MVVWPDGEWETWFFANWVPGAVRYRSFAEWMRHEAAEQRNEPYAFTQTPVELPTVYLDGPAKAKRRIRPREEVLSFDDVRKRLKSNTRSRRVKAVQSLCRMGGPKALSILLDLFKNDYDFHVRCEAADALGKLRAPEAIEALIAETSEYSRVSGSAIHAMAFFNDEQTAQCLIKLVEGNGMSAGVAAHVLALRKDSRGVKPLVSILLSKDPKDQHTGGIAGRFIAEFEEAGLAALESLVVHPLESIRQRALGGVSDIAGCSKSKDLRTKALKLLEQCLEREAGERMHQWLATCVAVAGGKVSSISDNPFSSE
jgi:HEAT repeat protein